MSTTFSAPTWVSQLTSVLVAALPTDFELIEAATDRHGSWEWLARTASRWLVLSATPLSDLQPTSTERPAVEVAAWQLTADASQIIDSTIGRSTLEPSDGPYDRAMGWAVAIVVNSALRTPHTETQAGTTITEASGEALAGEGNEVAQARTVVTLATGEALVGEGNEVAHIDLLLGSKSGPVGEAFAHAFVNVSEGHTNLVAVVTPNLPAKPDTMLSNKVTIKGARQAVQLFGPAQAAVSRAVVDSVAEGVIPKDQVDDLCLIVSVFIHWEAEDDQKIYDYNYEAVKMSIARALGGEPSVDKVLAGTPVGRHPFAGGTEG